MKSVKSTQALSALDRIAEKVMTNAWGSAEPWQGGDVVVTTKAPPPTVGGFYPDFRFVETPHVAELSWLFEQSRDAVWKLDGYGAWKEEVFGRLGNEADSLGHESTDVVDVQHLLLGTLLEAYRMVFELESPEGMRVAMLTFDNRIADDELERVHTSPVAVRDFFRERGLAV